MPRQRCLRHARGKHLPLPVLDASVIALVLMGHLAIATCLTSVAIYISSRVKVARAAQQPLSLSTLISIFVLTAASSFLTPDREPQIAAAELLSLLAGCAGLAAMARLFRRGRIFDGS